MFLALSLIAVALLSRFFKSLSNVAVTEQLWQVRAKVFPSKKVRELQETRDELLRLRQERSNTSSQDNFAKWARLDREFQRVKKVYDLKTGDVSASRQTLSMTVRITKWLLSTGLTSAVVLYAGRSPVVWLPYGLLPSIAERVVALPSAPRGSVSAGFWVFAVNSSLNSCVGIYSFMTTRDEKHKGKPQ